jgi:hypothetical protein
LNLFLTIFILSFSDQHLMKWPFWHLSRIEKNGSLSASSYLHLFVVTFELFFNLIMKTNLNMFF